METELTFYLMFNYETSNTIFVPDVYTAMTLLLLNWPVMSAKWIMIQVMGDNDQSQEGLPCQFCTISVTKNCTVRWICVI